MTFEDMLTRLTSGLLESTSPKLGVERSDCCLDHGSGKTPPRPSATFGLFSSRRRLDEAEGSKTAGPGVGVIGDEESSSRALCDAKSCPDISLLRIPPGTPCLLVGLFALAGGNPFPSVKPPDLLTLDALPQLEASTAPHSFMLSLSSGDGDNGGRGDGSRRCLVPDNRVD